MNHTFSEDAVRKACEDYIARGFSIVHWEVSAKDINEGRGKGPRLNGWTSNEYLVPPKGCGHLQVGIKTGAALRPGRDSIIGTEDPAVKKATQLFVAVVDIDDSALLEIAEKSLPATGMIGGREGAPRSHRFYLTDGPCNSFSWTGIRGDGSPGATIELFGVTKKGTVGNQIVVAPSIHYKSQTPYVWSEFGQPSIVTCEELYRECRNIAHEAREATLSKGRGLPARHMYSAEVSAEVIDKGSVDLKDDDPDDESVEEAARSVLSGATAVEDLRVDRKALEIILSDAVQDVYGLQCGGRQTGLNRIAYTTAARLAGGNADDETFDELKRRLLDATEKLPGEPDLRSWCDTINRAVADGKKNPRKRTRIEKYRLSAQGLADLLLEEWEPFYRYIQERKTWVRWNGKYWEMVVRENVARDMAYVLRWAQKEARRSSSKVFAKAAYKWYFKLESGDAAGRAEQLLHADFTSPSGRLGLGIRVESFDKDPWLVCTNNGYFDIRTGELRDFCREDMVTKHSSYNYQKGTFSKLFCDHIDFVFGEEKDPQVAKNYFAAWLGYCCTGISKEQAILVLHGNGRNGKTACLSSVAKVLGDYSITLAEEVMIRTRSSSTNNDGVAELVGRRWGYFSESSPQDFLNEGRIKMLTGGSTIRGQRKYEHSFEFESHAKLILDTNYKPRIHGADLGILRRVKIMPFKRTIPVEMVNTEWRNIVTGQEGDGLLSWLLDQAHAYYKRKSLGPEPTCVQDAFKEFCDTNDHVGTFLSEVCNTVGNDDVEPVNGVARKAAELTCGSAPLYQAYNQWARDNGLFPMSSKTLLPKLLEKGLHVGKTRAGMMWTGVELKSAAVVLAPKT